MVFITAVAVEGMDMCIVPDHSLVAGYTHLVEAGAESSDKRTGLVAQGGDGQGRSFAADVDIDFEGLHTVAIHRTAAAVGRRIVGVGMTRTVGRVRLLGSMIGLAGRGLGIGAVIGFEAVIGIVAGVGTGVVTGIEVVVGIGVVVVIGVVVGWLGRGEGLWRVGWVLVPWVGRGKVGQRG